MSYSFFLVSDDQDRHSFCVQPLTFSKRRYVSILRTRDPLVRLPFNESLRNPSTDPFGVFATSVSRHHLKRLKES